MFPPHLALARHFCAQDWLSLFTQFGATLALLDPLNHVLPSAPISCAFEMTFQRASVSTLFLQTSGYFVAYF
jgi:hypothetical protein